MTFDELPDILKVSDVAEYLRLSDKKVRSLLASGRLVGSDCGAGQRCWRIPKANLLDFINGGNQPPVALVKPTKRKSASLSTFDPFGYAGRVG